jgi:transcriptional regulator with XRE-family HTH domain
MSTNKSTAERIGLTHSTVSRIRNGQRFPSIAVMGKIEAETGWKVADQVAARLGGTYAETFRTKVLGVDQPVA